MTEIKINGPPADNKLKPVAYPSKWTLEKPNMNAPGITIASPTRQVNFGPMISNIRPTKNQSDRLKLSLNVFRSMLIISVDL